MTLVPLYDLTQQFNNKNGAILVGGRLYVYYVGRTELATTWADEDAAAQNTNPVLLDNNGRAPVFVDDSYSYTLVVCDRAGTELFSQDITPGGGDAGSVGGRIVYHDETLSGAGTVSSLLGVVNIPLGVDETMTAYTGVAEGKDALILGVNGDWFNETFSGEFDRKVDWEDFSACCINVKGGLYNKLDASAINNYYTKNEVDGRTSSFVNYNFLSGNYYNKFETSSREELYSAFLSAGQGGGGGGDGTPWITGAKIIDHYVQTLTDNMLVQVLSSFTLSGNKNHCIAVKGGLYRFPNKWEIASGIAETNYYMPQSSMSGYLPISSFSSYTTSIQNNLDNNWNYTGSAYGLAISNFLNKLDISAFSSWSANLDLSGDYLPTSASGNFYPMTGNPSGFLTEHQDLSHISGKIDDKLDTTALENLSGEFYPMTGNPSGFLTEHQSLEDYYKKTETSSKEEISAALKDKLDNDFSGNFYPMTGNPSGFLTEHQDISNLATKDELLDTSSFLSASISSISSFVSGNDDKYYPLTGNPSGFLTEHQDLSDYATTSVVNNISSYLSGEIDNKLDKSESANYYPMTGNPSGFLTAHQSLTDYYKKTETSSKEEISTEFTNTSAWANATFQPIGDYVVSSTDVIKPGSAWVLVNDNNNVQWSGLDVSELGKKYIVKSTNGTIGVGSATVGNVVTYDLSGAKIVGENGVSAVYNPATNEWNVGLEDNDIGFAKYSSSANVYTASAVVNGYTEDFNVNPTKINFDNNQILLKTGFYHVDVQTNFTIANPDDNYYNVLVKSIPDAASITQMIDGSYSHTETVDLSFDIRITNDDTPLEISVENYKTNETFAISNLNIHEIEGGAGNYQAGNGISIVNDTIAAKIGNGLEFNESSAIQVKLGKGLKFDDSQGVQAVTIDSDVNEVVETVQELQESLNTKITDNYPPAMITIADLQVANQTQYAPSNGGMLIGYLFTCPITHKIYAGSNNDYKTKIGIYTKQWAGDIKKVILGIYEYQPNYVNPDTQQVGKTEALCDTGIIELQQGYAEYDVKNLGTKTTHEMKPGCFYYATIYLSYKSGDTNGITLFGAPGYNTQVNNLKPGITITNVNCIHASLYEGLDGYSPDLNFDQMGFSWQYNSYPPSSTSDPYTSQGIVEAHAAGRPYFAIRNVKIVTGN